MEKDVFSKKTSLSFRTEIFEGTELDKICNLELPEDYYDSLIFPQKHFNFIATHGKEKFIVSVETPDRFRSDTYKGVSITKKGQELFEIQRDELFECRITSLQKKVLYYLKSRFGCEMYQIRNTKVAREIRNLEYKHPRDGFKQLKIAVIYSKGKQKDPKEMLSNTEWTSSFTNFMNIMGEKIQLDKWDGYRGDMGRQGETFYTKWNRFEAIYHVSLMMNSEGHRRLIGNDILVLIFHEGSSAFDPSRLESLGTMPQFFGVIRPVRESRTIRYKVGFLSIKSLKPVGPLIYSRSFDASELRDFLLTKLANAKMMSLQCPPLNRLYFIPRASSIEEIAKKFPKERKRERKVRQAKEIAERKQLRETCTDSRKMLAVTVIEGRNLILKDVTDIFCEVEIHEQRYKSTLRRKTSAPKWNEEFVFDVIGLELNFTDLKIRCRGWSVVDNRTIGRFSVPLSELEGLEGKDWWYTLQGTRKEFSEEMGELRLRFAWVTATSLTTINRSTPPRSPQRYGSLRSRWKSTRLLISKEHDPKSRSPQFREQLYQALLDGELKEVMSVAWAGADLSQPLDDVGQSALHLASFSGHLQIAEYILRSGQVDVNVMDNDQWTPFLCAASCGHIQMCEFLLSKGANPRLVNKQRTNVLHYLSRFPPSDEMEEWYLALLKKLVLLGVDVNATNINDETPLFLACTRKNEQAVRFLMEHNADPLIRSNSNKTPLDVAKELSPSLVEILESKKDSKEEQ